MLHWLAKIYLIVICSIFLYGSVTFIPSVYIKSKSESLIFSSAFLILYVAGTIHLLLLWLSNINTKTLAKIITNFCIIESILSKLNGFVQENIILFILIHLIPIAFVLYTSHQVYSSQVLQLNKRYFLISGDVQ